MIPITKRPKDISYLFLVRRRPILRNLSAEWEQPLDPSKYQHLIDGVDFVSIPLWKERTGTNIGEFPVVAQDVKDLGQILLPAFFSFSQKSSFYENTYYLTQWKFALGAFLTVVFGIVSLYENGAQHSSTSLIYSLITSLLAAYTAYSTLTTNRGEPRRQWARERQLAEEGRSTYFKYLAHSYPFNQEDRLQRLREIVVNLRLRELGKQQLGNTPFSSVNPVFRKSHNPDDFKVLIDIYLTKRIQAQREFYRNRVRENQYNANFSISSSVLLVLIAALAELISTTSEALRGLGLSAIGLSSIALLLMFFYHLYGWERLERTYQDALAGFESLEVIDYKTLSSLALPKIYRSIVNEGEKIVQSEVSQWGSSEGSTEQYFREGIIEIEPTFGPPPTEPQFQCDIFMIMPFAPEYQPVYHDQIIPLAREMKVNIKRGDDFFSEHSIMRDIWGGIYASRLVIAECTGRNPNVFYELGIAHTLGKPAIMITQSLEDTPFDLRHLRTIVYEKTPEGLQALNNELQVAINNLIAPESLSSTLSPNNS